ncbi:peptidase [Brevibacillus formosus]|uniref:Peptidase n=2 Tax=Brevibacillus formosus TaxID=54913 RepID=A0ABQ0TE04_9BACL|nr:peptidase [Brevibacillus formosus]MED1960748.1 peptidase [Brevibacillus formosus]GED61533.1 hypothetical protein BFO01nite_56650 [Brevibacillus formosus]
MKTTKQVTKQISKILKVCTLSVTLMSTILMSTSASAEGSYVESEPYNTSKINGYSYSFTSGIVRNDINRPAIKAFAYVHNKASGSGNVPIGYMGGQAVLYTSGGQLHGASDMKYNDEEVWGFHVYSPVSESTGKYYSQSRAEFYNGDDYDYFTGKKSPIMTINLNKGVLVDVEEADLQELMLEEEYDVNSKGETYGSLLLENIIGEEPDLISAVGTDGVEGYVRADDLTPVTSIKEALEQTIENGEVRTIPLYDVDGETVIGEFKLETKFEYITDTE